MDFDLCRRDALKAASGLALFSVAPQLLAHHGWSSFDEKAPIFLSGKLKKVQWQNPHAMVWLELAKGTELPKDLASRGVPAQAASVDGKTILANAKLAQALGEWEVELAPLARVQAWNIPELKAGATVEVVGYTFPAQKGARVLRAEFVFLDGKTYGLRSSPV